MRLSLRFFTLLGVLLFAASSVYAQYTVTQKELSRSQRLAGYAIVGFDGVPAKGVTVELCSIGWKDVISTTKTNEKGYFSLKQPASGRMVYIRLLAEGINPYQLRVRLDMKATKELIIHLSNAT